MSSRLKPIYITADVWRTVLMYSLSSRECLFLFGGVKRRITYVSRIRNISRKGQTTAEWDQKDYRLARQQIDRMGLSHLADGHSHCHERSLRHPSLVDIKNIRSGAIELICFPQEDSIRAWKIADTLKDTLKNEIKIIILNR